MFVMTSSEANCQIVTNMIILGHAHELSCCITWGHQPRGHQSRCWHHIMALSDINMGNEWPLFLYSNTVEASFRDHWTQLSLDKLHQTQILVRHQRPLCPAFPSLDSRIVEDHITTPYADLMEKYSCRAWSCFIIALSALLYLKYEHFALLLKLSFPPVVKQSKVFLP